MKTPSKIIDDLIKDEGGNSNHPDDLGGATRWGITEAVARDHDYQGPMSELPKMTAKLIYMVSYWQGPGFNLVHKLAPDLAEKLFEIGVNIGRHRAAKWLQRLLNLLTDMVLEVDGKIGPMTLNALHVYLSRRKAQDGEKTLLKAITGIQVCHYINIAEKRPKNRTFIYGWLRNRT
tara:strand:- start:5838 stop:6365 length:528 start_codon:yes stop_codon:yes gene_type:complete